MTIYVRPLSIAYDQSIADNDGYVYMDTQGKGTVYIGCTSNLIEKYSFMNRIHGIKPFILWVSPLVRRMFSAESYIKEMYLDMAVLDSLRDIDGLPCLFIPRYDIRDELDILIRKFAYARG